MQCFTHILNLVAKSLLQQFDVMKLKDSSDKDLLPEEEELLALTEGIDNEELTMAQRNDANDSEDPTDNDNNNSWIDEVEELSEEEC